MRGRHDPERRGVGTWSTVAVMAGCVAACLASRPSQAADAAGREKSTRSPMVDPAVVQAGHACPMCRDAHCRGCPSGGHRHHADCRHGKCHPSCPVRPREFGFYGTQWRRWPGQGVVPVANLQEATPALPPKSAVPGVDEESRGPRADELPAPSPDAAPTDSPEPPAAPPAVEPAPEPPAAPAPVPPEEAVPTPLEESTRPAPESPAETAPPAAEPPAADENLFDDSANRPAQRRFIARRMPGGDQPGRQHSSAVRQATLAHPVSVEALPRSVDDERLRVPPVPFDPAVEAARLAR